MFITITCHFLRLSRVRILPRAADHAKKPPLKKPEYARGSGYLQKEELDLEQTFFGGDPPQLVFIVSSHSNIMQCLEKRRKNIHLPIVCL
jgi:hypothetical protein